MKKILVFFALLFSCFAKDISINLNESVLNKFLTGVGSFSDKSKVDIKVSKFDLEWKVYDAKIDLIPKGSKFSAKIELVTEDKVRNGTVEGVAKFKFDKKTQKLIIDIKDLKVRDLGIYNLVGFYKPKYELPIKLIREEKIEVKKGEEKVAFLIPDLYEESVTVYDQKLLIEANIKFIEKNN